jgi:hypothetical protein
MTAISLPPGAWALVDPADPTLFTLVESGPRTATRTARADLGRPLGAWTRFTALTAAWLWSRSTDPARPVAFTWSELAEALGTPRPPAGTIDRMRVALDRLTTPSIRASGGQGLSPEPLFGFFDAERIHRRGDGQHHPTEPGSIVSPDPFLAPFIARGALSSVSLVFQRETRSDLVRRLALYATLATLRPVDADGLIRARLAAEPLLATLGVADRRSDRRSRRIGDATAELAARDERFLGSEVADGELLLVRALPLVARPEL